MIKKRKTNSYVVGLHTNVDDIFGLSEDDQVTPITNYKEAKKLLEEEFGTIWDDPIAIYKLVPVYITKGK